MTQARPRCIITGCDLVALDAYQYVLGDLFELCDVYIFNAVLLRDGETNWRSCVREFHSDETLALQKALTFNVFDGDYFERRGVFVIPKSVAKLTRTAKEYINAPR